MNPECQWPALEPRYDNALRGAVKSIFDRFQVRALLATGTILRGCPDSRSDLDIHVIHEEGFRQRLQEFHEGVPCEIFVNPLVRIAGYFEDELAHRRPISQHMFATGFIVYDPGAILPPLIERAKDDLATSPTPGSGPVGSYSAATGLEDICDLAERDPEAASVMLGAVVGQLIECFFRQQPAFIPRLKDTYRSLKERRPDLARLALEATTSEALERRLKAASELCIAITGHDGFFEWASDPEA